MTDLGGLYQAGALILIAFGTAAAALLLALLLTGRRAAARRLAPEVAFLFDGDALVDATGAGRRLLQFTSGRGSDMARLIAFLAPRFPDLQARVRACGDDDRMLLLSADNLSRLRLETRRGRLRICLEDLEEEEADPPDRHSLAALVAELETHRAVAGHVPVPVWRQDGAGRVTWANAAYGALADQARRADPPAAGTWPDLFPELSGLPLALGASHRLQLDLPGGETLWFDVSGTPLAEDRLVTALPADQVVTAERNLRDFIQTLTKTFALLSVGLAIFDRHRELTLFNPALADLLGLDVDFLVARPSLVRFLDQLRERHMIPEPKDYKTWRQTMSDLEAAAVEGGYSETWTLTDGRTFRITGRPHPEGAVAFLFEDISASVTLSRAYREELETGQAVIDTLDEAIAVFAADGRLSFANRAYAQLWEVAQDAQAQETFLEASRRWQTRCQPTPVWGDARDFAAEMTGRSSWDAEVRLDDGRRLSCRFEPLPGGGTMAGFLEIPAGIFRPKDAVSREAAGEGTAPDGETSANGPPAGHGETAGQPCAGTGAPGAGSAAIPSGQGNGIPRPHPTGNGAAPPKASSAGA